MTQLTTSTHIALFNDGSKKFMNKAAYKFMYEAIMKGMDVAPMGGQIINLKSLKLLASVEEFYKQYPQEKPNYTTRNDLTGYGLEKTYKIVPIRALRGMIKGMQRHIERTGANEKSESYQLLQKMLIREKEYEQTQKEKRKISSEI
jgi:hypothetical protein